jgi:hypothetical protein
MGKICLRKGRVILHGISELTRTIPMSTHAAFTSCIRVVSAFKGKVTRFVMRYPMELQLK